MLGKVGFEELKVQCIIGVDPHERIRKQELLLDVYVEEELAICSASDHLHDAEVNYATLAEICRVAAAETEYHLIEALAAHILNSIFTKLAVDWVFIRVKKPNALPDARCAVLEIERYRDEE